jgi:hypothetical protein
MTIIDHLQKQKAAYFGQILTVFKHEIHVFELDCSRGESDFTRILWVKKKDLRKNQAIAILTIWRKIFDESWQQYSDAKMEDFERWVSFLAQEYAGSTFVKKVDFETDADYFFVERTRDENAIKSIKYNAQIVDYQDFKSKNPLFLENIKSVSKSKFDRLKTEFYVETEQHFVLFHWFTTA